LRIFNILETRLSGLYTGTLHDYLVGAGEGKYYISNIGTWSWIKSWKFSGFSGKELSKFLHLLGWISRIAERPAVKRGMGDKYTMPEAKLPEF
jgi:glutathione S-transferase